MGVQGIDLIELQVELLRQAEYFYTRLFQTNTLRREVLTAEGWRTTEDGASPDLHGLSAHRVVLTREGLRLSLRGGAAEFGTVTRLGRICLRADAPEIERLRRAAQGLDCQIHESTPGVLVFEDPYGVCWQASQGE